MKKKTHPQYEETIIVCNTCKKEYRLGSTVTEVKVELCANCHPFYTGKEMLVDTDNLVEKFNKKRAAATTTPVTASKKQKRLEKRKAANSSKPVTLRDMLAGIN
jgi:large subunit ribosomal protein L31